VAATSSVSDLSNHYRIYTGDTVDAVDKVDVSLFTSSSFGKALTFFCFPAVMSLAAFHLTSLDAADFVREVIVLLVSPLVFVMADKWGWGGVTCNSL
jgi:hypothetical protein